MALSVDISLNFVDIETPVKIWSAKKVNRNSYHAQIQDVGHVILIHRDI
jgi:hypothetical protein